MHEHAPDELAGPVRGSTSWWQGMAGPPDTPAETPHTLETAPKKKRKSGQPIRKDLVHRVREEIAAGTYDTQEKWEAALDRLLDRLDTQ